MQPKRLGEITSEAMVAAIDADNQLLAQKGELAGQAAAVDITVAAQRPISIVAESLRPEYTLTPGQRLLGEPAERLFIAHVLDGSKFEGYRAPSEVAATMLKANQTLETLKDVVARGPVVLLRPPKVTGRKHAVKAITKKPLHDPLWMANMSEDGVMEYSIVGESDGSEEPILFGKFDDHFRRTGYETPLQTLEHSLENNMQDTTTQDVILTGLDGIRRKIADLINVDPVTAAVIAEASGIDPIDAQEFFGTINLEKFKDNLTSATAYLMLTTAKPLEPDERDYSALLSPDDDHRSGRADDLTAYRTRLRHELPEIPVPYLELAIQLYFQKYPKKLQGKSSDNEVSIIGIPYDHIYENALLTVEELIIENPLRFSVIGSRVVKMAAIQTVHSQDQALRPEFNETFKLAGESKNEFGVLS